MTAMTAAATPQQPVPEPRQSGDPATTELDPPTTPIPPGIPAGAPWPIRIGDTRFYRRDADAFASPIGAELAWEFTRTEPA